LCGFPQEEADQEKSRCMAKLFKANYVKWCSFYPAIGNGVVGTVVVDKFLVIVVSRYLRVCLRIRKDYNEEGNLAL